MQQNRSEKLKMSDVSAQFGLSIGFYSDFQIVHTKSAIKVQSFGVKVSEAQSTRWKPRSGEHMCTKPEGGHDFDPKRI